MTQDAEAIAKGYSTWEVKPSLDKVIQERQQTVEFYNSLTEDQIRLTVKHPILGEISIYDLAVFALGHDVYHLDPDLRAFGKVTRKISRPPVLALTKH